VAGDCSDAMLGSHASGEWKPLAGHRLLLAFRPLDPPGRLCVCARSAISVHSVWRGGRLDTSSLLVRRGVRDAAMKKREYELNSGRQVDRQAYAAVRSSGLQTA